MIERKKIMDLKDIDLEKFICYTAWLCAQKIVGLMTDEEVVNYIAQFHVHNLYHKSFELEWHESVEREDA